MAADGTPTGTPSGTLHKRKSKAARNGSARSDELPPDPPANAALAAASVAAPTDGRGSEQELPFGSEQSWQKQIPSRTSSWLWQGGMMLLVAAGLLLSGRLAGVHCALDALPAGTPFPPPPAPVPLLWYTSAPLNCLEGLSG